MATQTVNDDQLDALYASVLSCKPVVPPNEMQALADLVFSKEKVIRAWRCAAVIGSKDGQFFSEVANDSALAETLAPLVGTLKDAASLMRSMAEIMECASNRVAVAGCNHEDFTNWQVA